MLHRVIFGMLLKVEDQLPVTAHHEDHGLESVAWLRAAVLGANDGIVSTASLLLGVAAAHTDLHHLLVAGVAGTVAGAMSMAAGEYISVNSQSDTEKAALAKENAELKADYESEIKELVNIYQRRGVELSLALQVAEQLMTHDALGAHARDELGITEAYRAKPVQAALVSALSFALGGLLPLLVVLMVPEHALTLAVSTASLVALAILGGVAAKIGKANVVRGVMRVTAWSALAMLITAAIGSLFGTKL